MFSLYISSHFLKTLYTILLYYYNDVHGLYTETHAQKKAVIHVWHFMKDNSITHI